MEAPDSLGPCPFQKGDLLALKGNPSIRGTFTGKTKIAGSHRMLQLQLGPNQTEFHRETLLEALEQTDDPEFLLRKGSFAPPDALKKRMLLSRLTGQLTDVLYSIEASNTEFMPHQFIPVLKFLESPVGRLLIADEVGLGKTIEALYLWQELQARFDARRLLIVCPSTLREKWKGDLYTRFGITDAEILDAKRLYEWVTAVPASGFRKSFIGIVGLEGLRTRTENAHLESPNPRERLAGFLLEEASNWEEPLFDLVVIDEAHYLRNPLTASHQIGEALREVSRHFLLLTATPVHTGAENLYYLLRLLAPELFNDINLFYHLFESNRWIIKGANALLYKGAVEEAKQALKEAISAEHVPNRKSLKELYYGLSPLSQLTVEERVHWGRKLESLSTFSLFLSRSRKRDVFTKRVVRAPKSFGIPLHGYERAVYTQISNQIRTTANTAKGKSITHIFQLISLQRQLTSCFYAAIKRWKSQRYGSAEELWEDLGTLPGKVGESTVPTVLEQLYLDSIDLTTLYRVDTKYRTLRRWLQGRLHRNPREKIVIFSYYRATIDYLEHRLKMDGIPAIKLKGGMGDQKWEILTSFQNPEGPNVLVSSEVGSEGIDLQFSRFMVNYDLPWNPMRLEQRIGRLDRIGQKAKKIIILNLYRPDTIEDRVLMRLYERIEIFKESIGDMEDILGEHIEETSRILINPNLTEEERERMILQSQQALVEKRRQIQELENKAIDFFHHEKFILSQIRNMREIGRYVKPEEIHGAVLDFFSHRYPQTFIQEGPVRCSLLLQLSPAAKDALSQYMEEVKPPLKSSLSISPKPILCLFDPKTEPPRSTTRSERIPVHHPLIRWILSEYRKDQIHLTSAIRLTLPNPTVPRGVYLYTLQQWIARGGIRNQVTLVYYLYNLKTAEIIAGEPSEQILHLAGEQGTRWTDWEVAIYSTSISRAYLRLSHRIGNDFSGFSYRLEAENKHFCDQQAEYARLSAERKEQSIQRVIQDLQAQGKLKTIRAHEGRLKSVRDNLARALARIERKRNEFSPSFEDVAVGILLVE